MCSSPSDVMVTRWTTGGMAGGPCFALLLDNFERSDAVSIVLVARLTEHLKVGEPVRVPEREFPLFEEPYADAMMDIQPEPDVSGRFDIFRAMVIVSNPAALALVICPF